MKAAFWLLELGAKVEELVKNASKLINKSITLSYTEKSSRIDLVSETDYKVEEYLKSGLKEIYPDCRFHGEESVSSSLGVEGRLDDHPTWVVDPIDGTINLINGYPMYCISVALVIDKVPRLGVIYNPSLDELYSAVEGYGASLNNNLISTRQLTLNNALIMSEFGNDPSEHAYKMEQCKRVLKFVRAIRMTGSAALNLCMVARGAAQGYWEDGIKAWDIAAGIIILKEAGGYVCDYPIDSGKCVAACSEGIALEIKMLISDTHAKGNGNGSDSISNNNAINANGQ